MKPEQEEPDWENVHQQSEELQMRPYQRRFENRPLETRVFLLDPDNENKTLGQDEEIGREIEIKREPVSEDEEELGVDWSLAHEINRLDLEERESSEVPEEIKAQGARVTIDKGGSSISSESSSENSLLAALEEDDEEYVEERQKRRKRKDSKDAEEEKEEEDKFSEVAPEVSSPSSDESDSSILSEGRLALRNLTAESSESDDDDWEPSASRAARLAAKPKRSLRTQTRRAAAVTHTTTTTTTTISPLTQDQNYTVASPTTTTSSASPSSPTIPTSSSEALGKEAEENIEVTSIPESSEPAAVAEESEEPEKIPLWWVLHQEPFKNVRRRLDSSKLQEYCERR